MCHPYRRIQEEWVHLEACAAVGGGFLLTMMMSVVTICGKICGFQSPGLRHVAGMHGTDRIVVLLQNVYFFDFEKNWVR